MRNFQDTFQIHKQLFIRFFSIFMSVIISLALISFQAILLGSPANFAFNINSAINYMFKVNDRSTRKNV